MWIDVSNDLVLNECLATWYFCEKKTCAIIVRYWGVGRVLWLSRVAQLVAVWQRESGGRMRKWRGHGERMRKWRNIHSLYFYRTRVRSSGTLVSDSLTDSLLFSKLDWCDSGMWRWQLKTEDVDQDFEFEVQAWLWSWSLVNILQLMFCRGYEVESWSRFWS